MLNGFLVDRFLDEDVRDAANRRSDEAADQDCVRRSRVEAVAKKEINANGKEINAKSSTSGLGNVGSPLLWCWRARGQRRTHFSVKTCEIAPIKRNTVPQANPTTKLRAATMGSVKTGDSSNWSGRTSSIAEKTKKVLTIEQGSRNRDFEHVKPSFFVRVGSLDVVTLTGLLSQLFAAFAENDFAAAFFEEEERVEENGSIRSHLRWEKNRVLATTACEASRRESTYLQPVNVRPSGLESDPRCNGRPGRVCGED